MRHLKWNVNPFGGAVVDPKSIPVESDEFFDAIEVATKQWKIVSSCEQRLCDADFEFGSDVIRTSICYPFYWSWRGGYK